MDYSMKSYAIFAFVLLLSCNASHKKTSKERPTINNERANLLKDYALCYCLYEVNEFSHDARSRDGSLGSYVQLSDFSIQTFDTLRVKVDQYLDTVKYKSSVGSSLGMKKCISLYNNKEWNAIIESLSRP